MTTNSNFLVQALVAAIVAVGCLILTGCAGLAMEAGAARIALGRAAIGAGTVTLGEMAIVPEVVATEAVAMRVGAMSVGRMTGAAEVRAATSVMARSTAGEFVGYIERDAGEVVVRDAARNVLSRSVPLNNRIIHMNRYGREVGVSEWSDSSMTTLDHYILKENGPRLFTGRDVVVDDFIEHYDAGLKYIGRSPLLGEAGQAAGANGSIMLNIAALAAAAAATQEERH